MVYACFPLSRPRRGGGSGKPRKLLAEQSRRGEASFSCPVFLSHSFGFASVELCELLLLH